MSVFEMTTSDSESPLNFPSDLGANPRRAALVCVVVNLSNRGIESDRKEA